MNSRKSNGEPTATPPKSNGGNRSDSGLRTPDCGPLTPDSGPLTPDTGYLTPEVLTKERALSSQDLAVLWNLMAPPELAKVNLPFKRPPKEMAQVNDALKRNPEPEWWRKVIIKMHESPFLRGRNDRGWKPNFDFMVKKAEVILDGKYDEGAGPEPKSYKALREYMRRRAAIDPSSFNNKGEGDGLSFDV